MRHKDETAYRPANVQGASDRLVVISGCSGGGKSSLLGELSRRGFACYPEAGRQVVKEQLFVGGDALPWEDLGKFLELTISRAMNHMIDAASGNETAFFDRGIIDQIGGYGTLGVPAPAPMSRAAALLRYRRIVFMVPPWGEIYRTDEERRHGFDEAVAAYRTLVKTYRSFGYDPLEIPRDSIAARADFVIARLARSSP
ncbi:AAA family ATPase [Iodidimonas sp. SYSU 1G8]|uniref:AAA family ATPase n=1 Tax=Iodidimonas sp. SYSU 1G8 TaxID=3133967 RepID=UPI0031FE66AA